MGEAVGELIFGEVFQRHPQLTVLSVEAQLGWVPFAMQWMDTIFDKHRYWTQSGLKEKPSTFFQTQVMYTFMGDGVGSGSVIPSGWIGSCGRAITPIRRRLGRKVSGLSRYAR